MYASTNSATKASVGTLPHVVEQLKTIMKKVSYKYSLFLSISISIC